MTRYFDDGCMLAGGEHQIGDIHWAIGTHDSVWTGTAWTTVCHRCDQPMTGRDPQGWLICDGDGTSFRDVPVREVAP